MLIRPNATILILHTPQAPTRLCFSEEVEPASFSKGFPDYRRVEYERVDFKDANDITYHLYFQMRQK